MLIYKLTDGVLYMLNLHGLAKSYEEWQKGYLKVGKKKKNISLISAQVLRSFWQLISDNVDNATFLECAHQEGVEIFSRVVLNLLKKQDNRHINNTIDISPELFSNLIDNEFSQQLAGYKTFKTFEQYISQMDQTHIDDKHIAEKLVSGVIDLAKGSMSTLALNVSNTNDLTFLQTCLQECQLDSGISVKVSNNYSIDTLQEAVFELQLRQIVLSYVSESSISKFDILPSEITFYHRRHIEPKLLEHLITLVSEFTSSSDFTYRTLFNSSTDKRVELLDLDTLYNIKTECLSDSVEKCVKYIEWAIAERQFEKSKYKDELTALIHLQIAIVCQVNPNLSVLNHLAISKQALAISSLLHLLEYTKNKVGFDLIKSDIIDNFRNLKVKSISIAKVWILYLLEHGEFNPKNTNIEEWASSRFKFFVQKDQLIYNLSELTNKPSQFKNLKHDHIQSSSVQKSLLKTKNDNFVKWLEKYGIGESLIGVDLLSVTNQVNKHSAITGFDERFINALVSENYLYYLWDEVFSGLDEHIFVSEVLFDSIKTFTTANKEVMHRTDWNRLTSQVGGSTSKVYKRLFSTISNSLDLLSVAKTLQSRNQILASINYQKLILDRYSPIRSIGSGGNGYVIKAADNIMFREVAIKLNAVSQFTNPQIFLREARKLASLNHENVIQVYDFIKINKSVFTEKADSEVYGLVMEFHAGALTLDKYLQENNLSNDEKIRLFQGICDGVEAAHNNNLIHCDLKPENILVTKDGVPKLIDFGSSTSIESVASRSGTIKWLSPDAVRGDRVKKADDLYSLILILMFILDIDFDLLGEVCDPKLNDFDRELTSKIILHKLMMVSAMFLQDEWQRTNTGWEKVIGVVDDDIDKDYISSNSLSLNQNEFLNKIHNEVYPFYSGNTRAESLLTILAKGLMSSLACTEILNLKVKQAKPIKVKDVSTIRPNSNLSEYGNVVESGVTEKELIAASLLKQTPDIDRFFSNVLIRYQGSFRLDGFNNIAELKEASFQLLDVASNEAKDEFFFKEQLFLNGKLLTNSYYESLPDVSEAKQSDIKEVVCCVSNLDGLSPYIRAVVRLMDNKVGKLLVWSDSVAGGSYESKMLALLEDAKYIEFHC